MSDKAELLRRASVALKEGAETPSPEMDLSNKGNFDQVVSTGSTLLDLAISGGVTEQGGIPVGILMEIFGESGTGKTAITSEMAGNVMHENGTVSILDPEGRFDHEHAKIYGLDMSQVDYTMPDTVSEVFKFMHKWEPATEEGPNMILTDSLAALSTDMEMKDDDAMGMRRAKEFSEGLRKICRTIKNNNWLIACTNQVRVNVKTGGTSTPGGKGVGFYASVRIKLAPSYPSGKLKKTATINGVKQEKIYGIKTECTIIKNSVDAPFRTAPIYLIFDYGIDDLRANLEYLKDNSTATSFVFDDFSCKTINRAITYAEEHSLEKDIKERVIVLWNQIQSELKVTRKRKR